jgi:hypothetical protein
LSLEALRYGQSLDIEDAGRLSARLYFYNRFPASPSWLRKLPTKEAVRKYLGIDDERSAMQRSLRGWKEISMSAENSGWCMWARARQAIPAEQHTGNYKLYVSPACEDVGKALATTVEVMSALRGGCFKVGCDVYGLLRPDKIVAYFTDFAEVQEAAEGLMSRLNGCAVHGVPFSAEIGGDGLLSWGIDPPLEERTIGYQGLESWRLWISNRLANALIAARHSESAGIEPWRFALERVALEGVNTATWTPKPAMWTDPVKEPA